MNKKSPQRYVLFGTHPLFGDFVDAIHSVGGILSRVVRNMEEPPRAEGDRFEDRLRNYHDWLEKMGMDHRVQVDQLEDYVPIEGERPVAGFRGPKLEPLIKLLKSRHGLAFSPLLHASAVVSPMSVLGEGCFVGANTVIGPNTMVGRFSFCNRGVSIGHDAVLEDHVIVSPSAAVASRVRLGQGCVVGIGATVLENVCIGEGSYVAGGAVVLKNVSPHRLVAGVPAVDKKEFKRK
ncbi:MAG: acetyltransferase [Opitutales bacterium]|nr:acetyltransferase [Opitutales bacterium]